MNVKIEHELNFVVDDSRWLLDAHAQGGCNCGILRYLLLGFMRVIILPLQGVRGHP